MSVEDQSSFVLKILLSLPIYSVNVINVPLQVQFCFRVPLQNGFRLIMTLCLSTMKTASTRRNYLIVLTVFCICLCILLYRVGMLNKVTKSMKELNRFEEEHENKTGLEGVHLLHSHYKWVKKVKSLKQMRTSSSALMLFSLY
jgi:hypothetical protein